MNSKFLNDRSKMVANFKVFPNRTIGPDSTLYAEINYLLELGYQWTIDFSHTLFFLKEKTCTLRIMSFFWFLVKNSIKYDIIKKSRDIMKRLFLVENYKPILDLIKTEEAIKFVKDTFEKDLAEALSLIRVSAPLFVLPSSGLNDELNGVEERISFHLKSLSEPAEIVQSLAKWKRNALGSYGFIEETGLYTDMNAIRKDEELDSIHSAYVDQWDWKRIIKKEERTTEYLKDTVCKIYEVLKTTEQKVCKAYPKLLPTLPKEIYFITTLELEQMYPDLSPVERERKICKEKKAVFLMQIGGSLKNGMPHDGRAADYDDWRLNGDILVYYQELDIALELSSMGIRVDEESIMKQLKWKKEEYKLNNPYVLDILHHKLPYTIGGGIGQSRLCMFFLKKVHIGEVQASLWPKEDVELLKKKNIILL